MAFDFDGGNDNRSATSFEDDFSPLDDPFSSDGNYPAPSAKKRKKFGNRFSSGQTRSAGLDLSAIPWKVIILAIVVIVALVLVITNWAKIMAFIMDLLAILVIGAVLLFLLKKLIRGR